MVDKSALTNFYLKPWVKGKPERAENAAGDSVGNSPTSTLITKQVSSPSTIVNCRSGANPARRSRKCNYLLIPTKHSQEWVRSISLFLAASCISDPHYLKWLTKMLTCLVWVWVFKNNKNYLGVSKLTYSKCTIYSGNTWAWLNTTTTSLESFSDSPKQMLHESYPLGRMSTCSEMRALA